MKDILMQYNDLHDEIKNLEGRINKLQNIKIETDTVTGSDSEYPYIPRKYVIEGYNVQDLDRLNELKALLVERKDQCEDMKLDIERFISKIPDSLTRMVFQYRYVDGLSWQAIAMRIGKVHESYPRRDIHDKYLEGLDE